MTQAERRVYLAKELLAERPEYRKLSVSEDVAKQKRFLRSLMNVRVAKPVSKNFFPMTQRQKLRCGQ